MTVGRDHEQINKTHTQKKIKKKTIKLYNFGEGNKNFRGKQSWESNNKMRGVGVLKRVVRAGLTERMTMEHKLARDETSHAVVRGS